MAEERGFAEFASLYEKMVDWDRRLARELPFYRKLFADHKVSSVLDVACGPGRHAATMAAWGLKVTAADPDKGMIALAGEHARTKQVSVELIEADFLSLASQIPGPFDAIMCVGNSFPALRESDERVRVLKDFASLMSSSGILVIHLLNYEVLLKSIDAGAPVQVRTSTDGSVRFVKSFRRAGAHVEMSIEFRGAEGTGGRLVHELYPVNDEQLRAEIEGAGMKVVGTFGDYAGGRFERASSEDLIIVAQKFLGVRHDS
jgi:glycine/sarcosine N-methyltransferase